MSVGYIVIDKVVEKVDLGMEYIYLFKFKIYIEGFRVFRVLMEKGLI